MTWITSVLTIDDAIQRGQTVWDLKLDYWANFFASASNRSVQFPLDGQQGLPSVAGIAIGDASTVDRCLVRWNPQKVLPEDTAYTPVREVSVRQPLDFIQLGAQRIQPGGLGAIVISPSPETVIDASGLMRKSDGTTNTQLGASNPLLHLIFYLTPPSYGNLSKGRAPAVNTGNIIINAATPTTEQNALIVPTWGRRKISVTANVWTPDVSTTYAVSLRGAILPQNSIALSDPVNPPGERTVFAAPGLTPGMSTGAVLVEPDAAYFLLYYTRVAGSGVGTSCRITWAITYED